MPGVDLGIVYSQFQVELMKAKLYVMYHTCVRVRVHVRAGARARVCMGLLSALRCIVLYCTVHEVVPDFLCEPPRCNHSFFVCPCARGCAWMRVDVCGCVCCSPFDMWRKVMVYNSQRWTAPELAAKEVVDRVVAVGSQGRADGAAAAAADVTAEALALGHSLKPKGTGELHSNTQRSRSCV